MKFSPILLITILGLTLSGCKTVKKKSLTPEQTAASESQQLANPGPAAEEAALLEGSFPEVRGEDPSWFTGNGKFTDVKYSVGNSMKSDSLSELNNQSCRLLIDGPSPTLFWSLSKKDEEELDLLRLTIQVLANSVPEEGSTWNIDGSNFEEYVFLDQEDPDKYGLWFTNENPDTKCSLNITHSQVQPQHSVTQEEFQFMPFYLRGQMNCRLHSDPVPAEGAGSVASIDDTGVQDLPARKLDFKIDFSCSGSAQVAKK